ncbi:phage tail sheath family protein [Bacillus sp. FSL K6-0047]
MNGGTFTPGVEKARAGIYFNFRTTAMQRVGLGDRGTVALPVLTSWGEAKKFISISSVEDLNKKIGLNVDDPSLLLYREAMKKAKTVLLYRLVEGEKARATIGELQVVAKYGGEKGNEISIRINENVFDADKRDVLTFVGTDEVDRQTVTTIEELKNNNYVEFSGEGTFETTAGTYLLGGANGTASNGDYTTFLEAAENEYFDTIALPVKDNEQLKATFVAFIKRLRDRQGLKVQGVLANYPGDYEGIINVTDGVLLADGTEITPELATAWVAGASAAATFRQSLTFVQYEGAVDVLSRKEEDEIINRMAKGEFLFTFDPRDKSVTVEKDINSLTSFTSEKNQKFAKNKILRVLDGINNDLTHEIKSLIKNRKDAGNDIPANNDGIQLILTLCSQYFSTLAENNGIENFDPETDIQISLNEDRDGFLINAAAQPVDAAEKFYFSVEVK